MKRAFTLLELVLVIMVVGIIASVAIPRLERNNHQEGIDMILSSIRYTQNLALMDNKHLYNNSKWQRRWWKIMFAQCPDTSGYYFKIGSDDNMSSTNGSFSISESAMNPKDGKPFYMDNTLQCSMI